MTSSSTIKLYTFLQNREQKANCGIQKAILAHMHARTHTRHIHSLYFLCLLKKRDKERKMLFQIGKREIQVISKSMFLKFE